jgi:phosphoribosylglycinamide formyltransferase-1
MRVVILGSGRGSNAAAILEAQRQNRLGRARVVAILPTSRPPRSSTLARFGVPSRFVDPAPFKTKLEGRARPGSSPPSRMRSRISWC